MRVNGGVGKEILVKTCILTRCLPDHLRLSPTLRPSNPFFFPYMFREVSQGFMCMVERLV